MFPLQMDRTTIFGVAAAVMFWSTAMAQTVVDATGIKPFDQLSPGNQLIAKSLFDAQQAEDGDVSWSLDDIAVSKRKSTGWSNVFKRMREEYLVEAKNLGQLISRRSKRNSVYRSTAVDGIRTINANTARAASGQYRKLYRSDVVVTTANGGRVVVGLINPGHRQRSFAKARVNRTAPGGARKVTTVATRQMPGRPRKIPGTLGRVSQSQVTAVRNAFAARSISTGEVRFAKASHPRGTRGRKAK